MVVVAVVVVELAVVAVVDVTFVVVDVAGQLQLLSSLQSFSLQKQNDAVC